MEIRETIISGQVYRLSEPIEVRFLNSYYCPYDGAEWEDTWDCMCNDRCPTCHREISPSQSTDLET